MIEWYKENFEMYVKQKKNEASRMTGFSRTNKCVTLN